MTTSTLTLDASALKALLQPVHFAGTDSMLPVLTAVVLETHGVHVRTIATNRFVVGVSRYQPPEQVEPFRAHVRAADLKQILSTFKRGPVTLELTEETLTASAHDGPTLTFRLFEDTDGWPYTAMMKILREATAPLEHGAHVLGIDPAYLGLLQKVGAVVRAQSIQLRFGATSSKPAVATIGDDFLALVMPRRLPSEAGAGQTDWAVSFEAAS